MDLKRLMCRLSFHDWSKPKAPMRAHPKEVRELIEAIEDLRMAGWNLLDSLREKYSEEILTEAKEVIEKAAEKINEMEKKLRETNK